MALFDFTKDKITSESVRLNTTKDVSRCEDDLVHGRFLRDFLAFDKDRDFICGDGDGEHEYSTKYNLTNTHWGQLKLFIAELQLLVYYGDKNVKEVIYIGSCPGHHLFILCQMFPEYNFHLYDKREEGGEVFDRRLKELDNVNMYWKYFTDEEAERWRDKNIIFISDIRALNMDLLSPEKSEELIKKDMEMQKRWLEIINPVVSSLKFRPPHDHEFILKVSRKITYLDGDIYWQFFHGRTSTEGRLVITGPLKEKEYDIKQYARKCFYHNTHVRGKVKFLNPIDGSNEAIFKEIGLNNDLDSTAYTVIVMDYLRRIGVKPTKENVQELLFFIDKNILENATTTLMKKKTGAVEEDEE